MVAVEVLSGRFDVKARGVLGVLVVPTGGVSMSRNQFAFVVGVLLVWLAWVAGWVVLAAVAAGLIGLVVVRVLDGGLDLSELSEQIRSSAKRSK
jgi:hypothetical protein